MYTELLTLPDDSQLRTITVGAKVVFTEVVSVLNKTVIE